MLTIAIATTVLADNASTCNLGYAGLDAESNDYQAVDTVEPSGQNSTESSHLSGPGAEGENPVDFAGFVHTVGVATPADTGQPILFSARSISSKGVTRTTQTMLVTLGPLR